MGNTKLVLLIFQARNICVSCITTKQCRGGGPKMAAVKMTVGSSVWSGQDLAQSQRVDLHRLKDLLERLEAFYMC